MTKPSREVPAKSSEPDPFLLGWRYRLTEDDGPGEPGDMIPLSPEDLLYPEEGDVVADGYPHYLFLRFIVDPLVRFLERRPGLRVTSDVLLVLGDGRNAAPDVAVLEGDFDAAKIKRGIRLKAVGARLIFVLEAISTSAKAIENKDLEGNLTRYAREGVPEYFTVYPTQETQVRDLVGRELRGNAYVEIPADDQGRVYSKRLGLYFSIDPSSHELVAVDAKTGERLRTTQEEIEARAQAEARLAEVELKGLRRNIEDLVAAFNIEWNDDRQAVLNHMSLPVMEELRQHLLSAKRWPEDA